LPWGLDVEQSGLCASFFITHDLFDKMDEVPDEVNGSLGERFQGLRYRAFFPFEAVNLGRRYDFDNEGDDSSNCFGEISAETWSLLVSEIL
jgi:hypothetical protein